MRPATRFGLPFAVSVALVLSLGQASTGNEIFIQSRPYCCNLNMCADLNLPCSQQVSARVKPDYCDGGTTTTCRTCVDWTVSGCLCDGGSSYCIENGAKYYGTQVPCPQDTTK